MFIFVCVTDETVMNTSLLKSGKTGDSGSFKSATAAILFLHLILIILTGQGGGGVGGSVHSDTSWMILLGAAKSSDFTPPPLPPYLSEAIISKM